MIHIVFFKNKHYSDKTHRMQKMLYISLFLQTLSFFMVYLVPLFAVLLVFMTNSLSVSTIITIIFAVINCYELSNYVIIVSTISYFRNFAKRVILCVTGVRLSLETTVTVVRPFVGKNFKNNVTVNFNNVSLFEPSFRQ